VKRIILMVMAGLLLSGCDNSNDVKAVSPQSEQSKAERPKPESAKFDCNNGSVSLECHITAGDQLGSGKWRHAKLNLSGSDASLIVDGESFYKDDVNSYFADGERVTTFGMKGIQKSKAEITLTSANEGSRLSVNVWDENGKLMLTSSR